MDRNNDNVNNLNNNKEKYKKKILNNKLKIIGSVVFLVLLNYSSKYVLFPLINESDKLLKLGESFLFESDLASIVITLPVSYLTVMFDVSKYLENKKINKIIDNIDTEIEQLSNNEEVEDKIILIKDKKFDYKGLGDTLDKNDYNYKSVKSKKLVRKRN